MSLNKQKILSELGSVVNQLQSADCGCMGKLFGNSQNVQSFPQQGGYGYGCHGMPCHGYHGCHSASHGEPYSMNTSQPVQSSHNCMRQCNAPKLYSDTYNYLNKNLMQPVVKEVYNDLSTISPANTIMNNELGNKMGLVPQGFPTPHPTVNQSTNLGSFDPSNQNMQMSQFQQSNPNSQLMQNSSQNQYVGGMGPQIMNMIHGAGSAVQPQHQLTAPMVIDAPQSPHGKVGVTPLTTTPNQNYNSSLPQANYNINSPNQDVYLTNTPQSNPMQQTQYTQNMQLNQPTQMAQKPAYGQHTPGIKKFNEMFPGVMQGLGGNLGFDPMAIAIQMNPANHQQVAMNTMQKMMNGNQNIAKMLEPSSHVTPELKTAAVPNPLANQNQILVPNPNDNTNNTNAQINANALSNSVPMSNTIQPNQKLATQQPTNMAAQNQQMYNSNDLKQSPNESNAIKPQLQQVMDPTTGAVVTAPVYSHEYPKQAAIQQYESKTPQYSQNNAPQMKEPIFPAEKQNIVLNKKYTPPTHFNTLGQPIEKLPANMYHHPLPPLPQTLSPQVPNQGKYSNVKYTESKTSLAPDKRTNKTPSRSQLQQIYNQYKGSQSFTQQNVKTPVEGASHSERYLNVNQNIRNQNAIPVEKIGGDYIRQNENTDIVHVGKTGDNLQDNKAHGDLGKPEKDVASNNKKCRNGLQDMVYTSYPTSAAWSFHGERHPARYSPRRGRRSY